MSDVRSILLSGTENVGGNTRKKNKLDLCYAKGTFLKNKKNAQENRSKIFINHQTHICRTYSIELTNLLNRHYVQFYRKYSFIVQENIF